jgi:protoporphyrinogen oxidase
MPLPEFVRLCKNVPVEVTEAANQLLCTELILVNVEVPHILDNKFHWCYVYDENLLSTRITSYGELSPFNVPSGCSGLQVEVYGSRCKPFAHSHNTIGEIVVKELKDMGLIRCDSKINYHTHYSKYANVVFDLKRESCLEIIWNWLSSFGLQRECNDLDYGPNWEELKLQPQGRLMMAGRFAQWNYSWTHDCVLRAHYLSECLKNQKN